MPFPTLARRCRGLPPLTPHPSPNLDSDQPATWSPVPANIPHTHGVASFWVAIGRRKQGGPVGIIQGGIVHPGSVTAAEPGCNILQWVQSRRLQVCAASQQYLFQRAGSRPLLHSNLTLPA